MAIWSPPLAVTCLPMALMELWHPLMAATLASFMEMAVMRLPVVAAAMPAGLVMAVWAARVLMAVLAAKAVPVVCCWAMAAKAAKVLPAPPVVLVPRGRLVSKASLAVTADPAV